MTPQEQELIKGLFDRLSQLESQPRDPEAVRLIAQGLTGAPHAIYPLVQTVLLQDEALKRANARIEELQVQTSAAAEPEQPPTSFLDSMREALGGRAPHGSVPSVRTAGGQQPQPGAPGFGSGGSFLGTAASTAAGVIGGSLLLGGIRSMFGHQLGGTYADREQDRQQELADADREQDRQQDLADDRQQELADADREQDAEQDLADEDAQQDSEQDLTDDEDFASGDGFSDDGYDA
jgi:uncharacterized protein